MSDQFRTLYDEARIAGCQAVVDAVNKNAVVPMLVGQETSPFSGKMDYSKPVEYISDGVCGFAWINIKSGNCAFANWLKKNNLARRDEYYGGVTVWVSDYNQSMQKKEIYARAFAKVIQGSGLVKSAIAMARMD